MSCNIFICPSSGGMYPAQYGILRLLLSAGIKPDKCFGTSGGALALALASAANWKPSEMTRIASELSDSLVFQSWWPTLFNFLPSAVPGYKRGSMMNRSGEAIEFFKRLFKSVPTDVEMWIGTYNVNTSRQHFFLNKKTDLDFMGINFQHFACDMPSVSSDVNEFGKALIASFSIPGLLPPVQIGKDHYSDGGVFYASPLSIVFEILPDHSHITYISSSNTATDNKLSLSLTSADNLIETLKSCAHTLTRGLCVLDVSLGLQELSKKYKTVRSLVYARVNEDSLAIIDKERREHKSSFLKLYPSDAEPLNIQDFDGHDVKALMNEAHQNCDAVLYLYD